MGPGVELGGAGRGARRRLLAGPRRERTGVGCPAARPVVAAGAAGRGGHRAGASTRDAAVRGGRPASSARLRAQHPGVGLVRRRRGQGLAGRRGGGLAGAGVRGRRRAPVAPGVAGRGGGAARRAGAGRVVRLPGAGGAVVQPVPADGGRSAAHQDPGARRERACGRRGGTGGRCQPAYDDAERLRLRLRGHPPSRRLRHAAGGHARRPGRLGRRARTRPRPSPRRAHRIRARGRRRAGRRRNAVAGRGRSPPWPPGRSGGRGAGTRPADGRAGGARVVRGDAAAEHDQPTHRDPCGRRRAARHR